MAAKTEDLPGVEGRGVSIPKIEAIEKAIAKYERKKEARCAVSPAEIAAKQELQVALHESRDKLPLKDGVPFYRCDDRDYFLEEVLKIKKVESEED